MQNFREENLTDQHDQLDRQQRRRAQINAACKRYRLRHPDRARIQRLRDAKRLLEKEGFSVTGGVDLSNVRAHDDPQAATATSDPICDPAISGSNQITDPATSKAGDQA